MSKEIIAVRSLMAGLRVGFSHQGEVTDEDAIWQKGYIKALDDLCNLIESLEEALHE